MVIRRSFNAGLLAVLVTPACLAGEPDCSAPKSAARERLRRQIDSLLARRDLPEDDRLLVAVGARLAGTAVPSGWLGESPRSILQMALPYSGFCRIADPGLISRIERSVETDHGPWSAALNVLLVVNGKGSKDRLAWKRLEQAPIDIDTGFLTEALMRVSELSGESPVDDATLLLISELSPILQDLNVAMLVVAIRANDLDPGILSTIDARVVEDDLLPLLDMVFAARTNIAVKFHLLQKFPAALGEKEKQAIEARYKEADERLSLLKLNMQMANLCDPEKLLLVTLRVAYREWYQIRRGGAARGTSPVVA